MEKPEISETKIRCFEKECIHNLMFFGETLCNLKFLNIGKEGKCVEYTKITDEYKENKKENIFGKK